jgi:glycosyltransferase involved in cell wall biosynthesis
MNSRLISVIVPIYNVESILSQTYKNLEIICIYDGSADETLPILIEGYQKNIQTESAFCFLELIFGNLMGRLMESGA